MEGQREYILQPSNYQLQTELVNETLFVGANALAENIVCPTLVGEDDRDEDQRNNRHDCKCILR